MAVVFLFFKGNAAYGLRISDWRSDVCSPDRVDRRLAPARRTCEAVGERLETRSRRVARASQLLRARVDIQLEAQNRTLLESMNRRARLQLRLQQTVEGLSVAAITYYLASLVGYLAKGAKAFGLKIEIGRAHV